MCRVRRQCLGLLAALLLASCSSDKGFATLEVSRDDYGAKWPLTVDRGVLACEPGEVATFTTPQGRSYGLEGMASEGDATAGFRRIWAADREGSSQSRSDLSPLVDDALALCD